MAGQYGRPARSARERMRKCPHWTLPRRGLDGKIRASTQEQAANRDVITIRDGHGGTASTATRRLAKYCPRCGEYLDVPAQPGVRAQYAVRVLVGEGLVYTVIGRGTFVAGR